MPSCVLRYCTNNATNTNKAQGVTFHKFLRPGHEKREEWIRFVQKNRSEETWLPSNHSRICSVHFKDEYKCISKAGRIFLKESAVPCDIPELGEPSCKLEPLSESVSSSESIFDSPRKIVLKIKLRKECAARKKLAEKFKIVRRQNYYLKKKIDSYKSIIQQLKDKFGCSVNVPDDLIAKII